MKILLSQLAFKANRAQKSRDNMPEAEKEERYRMLREELIQHTRKHPHLKRVPTFGINEDEDLLQFEDPMDSFNGTTKRYVFHATLESLAFFCAISTHS